MSADMERVKIAGGLDLSRLVYGLWRLGDDKDTRAEHVRAKIDACLDQGITTLDNADIYGDYTVEELLGNALTKELRQKVEIVTKCDIVAPCGRYSDAPVKHYDTSRSHIESSVEHALRLMKIEAIDLLLIHRPDPLMDHQETGRCLDDLVASGKVRAVGVSNFRPWDWDLLQSAMDTPLATNQIELSLIANDAFTNGDVARHQQDGVPIMAWSPLAGGAILRGEGQHTQLRTVLSEIAHDQGVGMSAVAVAWLLHHPARIMPVLGTNNLERIGRISNAMKVRMDRVTWFRLYQAALGREVA